MPVLSVSHIRSRIHNLVNALSYNYETLYQLLNAIQESEDIFTEATVNTCLDNLQNAINENKLASENAQALMIELDPALYSTNLHLAADVNDGILQVRNCLNNIPNFDILANGDVETEESVENINGLIDDSRENVVEMQLSIANIIHNIRQSLV
jgi:exonuclease V gamma subunit